MYEELVKRLRDKAGGLDYDGWVDTAASLEEAADAIEELQRHIGFLMDCIYSAEDALDRGTDNEWAREALEKAQKPLPEPPKEDATNFCADCLWYESEQMYCFRQGNHSYDNGNCELWEPNTQPPKEEP